MAAEKIPVSTKNNLVQRRDFLSRAATLAGASLVGGAGSTLLESSASAALPPGPALPSMTPGAERKLARWQDQRWLLDAVIAALGPEWDQGRLGGLANIPCGAADAAGLRASTNSTISRANLRAPPCAVKKRRGNSRKMSAPFPRGKVISLPRIFTPARGGRSSRTRR